MKAIDVVDLTKYYGKARGIKNLTFHVKKGEIFGFIGPNGAGKSTTIRTLLGLVMPSSGHASVLSMDVVKHKCEVLKRVGYLPSEMQYWHGMTVAEVLKFSAGLFKMDCKKEADALCERLELPLKRRVEELSLGNRKKVAIVCALQHAPELLILDEPTSGLDPLMQHTFFQILRERVDNGCTAFLSSHMLSEVARHCDRAAIIRDGCVLRCAPVSELSSTKIRRVILRGTNIAPDLQGLKDVRVEKNKVSFLYNGRADELVRALSGMEISDMTVNEPDFEEIVLYYYYERQEE